MRVSSSQMILFMNFKEFGVSVKLLNCSADTRRSYMVLHRPTGTTVWTRHSSIPILITIPAQIEPKQNAIVFTARCTLVQSAVLRSHVVCPSVCPFVCPSVTLVNCDHIGWNSSEIISPSVSSGRSLFATPTWRVCFKGTPLNFGQKSPTPLLFRASETFDRKLRPNGHR